MQARRQAERRRRLLTGAFSAAAHAAAIAAIFLVHADEPQTMDVETIPVTLVTPPKPPEPPAPPAESPKPPTAAKPPSVRVRPARTPPPEAEPRLVAKAPSVQEVAELSDAEVAGASTAESGGGGGGAGCNMARWLQSRLRGDPLVQTAMASAHPTRPLLVWNGDWIRHGEEEGNGLAALREAIMWEVGFAPQACRAEPVHGLVLLSLADAPGGARVALGRGEWRWTDLLSAHPR